MKPLLAYFNMHSGSFLSFSNYTFFYWAFMIAMIIASYFIAMANFDSHNIDHAYDVIEDYIIRQKRKLEREYFIMNQKDQSDSDLSSDD